MASIVNEVGAVFVTLAKGFTVTLRTMFKKTTTEAYPDVPASVQARQAVHLVNLPCKTAGEIVIVVVGIPPVRTHT